MVNVIKATGEKEPFSEKKVRSSIKRAGIPHTLENQVAAHVISKLYDNIPTSEIYHHIIEFLGTSTMPHAKSKYSLKQAVMELGPTGYPFEDYFADILKINGFTTRTRVILSGKCISHEIDVVAQKKIEPTSQHIMVEAKFHNVPGIKTDVHVALYTKSRFDDVKEKNGLDSVWLVTNTKVTQDAVDYALCSGIKIVSWGYPEGESLRDMVEESNLFPITALTSLSQNQKQILLNGRVVLCKDIASDPEHLLILNLPEDKKREVLSEAKFLANNSPNNEPSVQNYDNSVNLQTI